MIPFLFQALLSSSLWNYSVITFSDLLDTDMYIQGPGGAVPTPQKYVEQNQVKRMDVSKTNVPVGLTKSFEH